MNKKHDYTINERSRRFRAKKKLEREAAQLIANQQAIAAATVAKEVRKAELAAKRAEQGLPPALTSTERSRKTRERQKAAREAAEAESNRPISIESIANLVL